MPQGEEPPELPDGASFDANGTPPAGSRTEEDLPGDAPPDVGGMPEGQPSVDGQNGPGGGLPGVAFEISGESKAVKITASTAVLAMGSEEALSLGDIQVGSVVAITLASDGETAQSITMMDRGNGKH